jgi:RND family efflux transporter MFP subunit
MTKSRTAAALLALSLTAAGCRDNSGAVPEKAAESPPVAVEAAAVVPRDLTDGIEVIGSLAPRQQADIKSEISGRIAEVAVLEWSAVKQGQPLARIDTSELEVALHKSQAAVIAAEANRETARASSRTAGMGLAEAKVATDRAQRELDRLRSLKESGLATQQALDEARSLRESSEARLAALQAQIDAAESQVRLAEAQLTVARDEVRQVEARLAKAVIRAPFDGVVAERLVNVGEVVGEMQKVIFRVVDNRVLDLTAQVPARLSSALRVGLPLTFTADTLPGRVFSGTVKHINPAVSEFDRSVRFSADVPNPDSELRGGIFVRGTIETGRHPGALLVPRGALLAWDTAAQTAAVFVVEGGAARRREVRTGGARGDEVVIAAGLAPGERVVTRGGFTLREGDRVALVEPREAEERKR